MTSSKTSLAVRRVFADVNALQNLVYLLCPAPPLELGTRGEEFVAGLHGPNSIPGASPRGAGMVEGGSVVMTNN